MQLDWGTLRNVRPEIPELFKEQCGELDELIETGSSYKDVNRRMWKIKELLCGPKVGLSEPACIDDPVTGDLITDKDTIKKSEPGALHQNTKEK